LSFPFISSSFLPSPLYLAFLDKNLTQKRNTNFMQLENVMLVLPDGVYQNSAIRSKDGIITDIKKGKKFSGFPTGLVVIPGLIDLHGDMLEREIEPRPTSRFPVEMALDELDKRHVASGITTAYVALSFADFAERADDLRLNARMTEVVEAVVSRRDSLSCDTKVHARFEIMNPEAASLLETMIAKKQVEMVSLMDHTPGQGQFRDLENYVLYMMKWLKVGRDAAQKELERQLAQPKTWESVQEICRLAKAHGLPIASHDDDTEAKVSLMQELGVTISEFPVSLEAARTAKIHGMHTLMGAPNALRGRSHSGNLSALEALHCGQLDALSSDYYPAAMLYSAFELARRGLAPLHKTVKLVSLHPALAATLNNKGSLETGKDADMVVVQCLTTAKVVATFRAGSLVYWSGDVLPVAELSQPVVARKSGIPLLAFFK
jgi:alpha-D-ribose 1-methylphosphonate 5-triphosphate diphosphatase